MTTLMPMTKFKMNIKVKSLSLLAGIRSIIFTTLSQLVAMAGCSLSTEIACRISKDPRRQRTYQSRYVQKSLHIPSYIHKTIILVYPQIKPICHSLKRRTSSAFPKYKIQKPAWELKN